MYVPADVFNDSCGCSTTPLNLNYLTSAPSRHYYCMASWLFLLIRTVVHYSENGKNRMDTVLQGERVPPNKNHPLNYEWTFDLISCDALTGDCGGVFWGNLPVQNKRRGFWERNSRLFQANRGKRSQCFTEYPWLCTNSLTFTLKLHLGSCLDLSIATPQLYPVIKCQLITKTEMNNKTLTLSPRGRHWPMFPTVPSVWI